MQLAPTLSSAVRTLKTSEAAALLNVSPNTLRAWERRFGYPQPQRSPGKHRLYTHGEVAALRDALQEGLSISSAVSRAREALSADTNVLVGALHSFELERADGAMEAALALRSVERSV
jgi:MerR family transcriptional regulator, light-induced transcriptional regulator